LVGVLPGAVSVPVLTALPTSGSLPLQEPDAVQLSALLLDQVSAAAWPATMLVGVASMLTATLGGCGDALTTTVTLCAVLPPGPAQVNTYEYTPAAVTGPLLVPPLEVGSAPDHASAPLPPLAAHEVALFVVHVNDVACPGAITVGCAANDTVGGAGGAALLTFSKALCSVTPPVPVQVRS
jgi:hypothetical protein